MGDKRSFYHDVQPLQFDTLVYPGDMGPEKFYPDCVCFTIKKRIGVSLDDMTDAISAGFSRFQDGWNKMGKAIAHVPSLVELQKELDKDTKDKPSKVVKEEVMAKAVDAYMKANPTNHKIDDTMFEVIGSSIANFGTTMQGIAATKKALRLGKDSSHIIGHIYLNMPNGIQFTEAANWSGSELGFAGQATQDLISGEGELGKMAIGALAGGAGAMVGATIGAIPALVSKLGVSGGMLGAAIGAMAAGGPIQKGMESALGVAQNPYMEMMFSGIGFRKFQFEFILRPRSDTEVDTVAKILKMLRTFTKPTFTEGKVGKSFMDYPMQFGIEFLTSGGKKFIPSGKAEAHTYAGYEPNPHVPKIKTSVCDNVTSNFTPQSIWATHHGGAPVAVTLSLSFQETELVMAEDVHDKEY